MSKTKKYRAWIIGVLCVLLVIIVGVCCWGLWLTRHYKQILAERIPQIIASSTDSLYHISFDDIDISYYHHDVVINNVHLQADTMQAHRMRMEHRHIPTTLHKVAIKKLEITGIAWKDLADKHSFDCNNATIYNLKWDMTATPHPEDSLFARKPKKKPYIDRISAQHFKVENPDVSYHYKGPQSTFKCLMKGGNVYLDNWAYNYNDKEDTSVFLYSKKGMLRLDSFILIKPSGHYGVKKPKLDFVTGEHSVSLKNVGIKHMINTDPGSKGEKEIYDLKFPEITIKDFNWNKLINDNTLAASNITAEQPDISLRYFRAAETQNNKMGSYPQQLLLQVALHTYIERLNIANGLLKYVEITDKGHEGLIEFTGIKGSFENITNIDNKIAQNKNCTIKLKGKFMNKSAVDATFNLGLADKTGKFTLDGSLKNLDGDEVLEQTRAFTIVEVTSFHLSEMDFHERGDESVVKGDYTVMYDGLKISLLKFKSDHRKGKKGPFSFLGSTLLLYPSNPMPGEEPRKVSVSFAREQDKGFINMIWKNMYYAAKKTAMRNDNLLKLTDGKETDKGEQPKKGFFKRLFGKHKDKQ